MGEVLRCRFGTEEAQRCRCRGADLQVQTTGSGFRDAEVHRCRCRYGRGAKVQRCRGAEVQDSSCRGVMGSGQRCRYGGVQRCCLYCALVVQRRCRDAEVIAGA